jgi:hypothetical protein
MPDQTPDYVPRPSSSSGVAIVAAVVLLLVVLCGVGLLGARWLRSSAVPLTPIPLPMPSELTPPPITAPDDLAEPATQPDATPEPQ